ncbi:MAG: ATP-binding protein, partial [Candidatus Cloacimonetes bacterium]|nr:ATP-binding protein [Candidatus Cloacimonadota bacterium]
EENNQKLKNLNQELQAFYYSVSHDLKAPLRSISGFSEALIESFGSELDTKANDYLHRIFKGTMEMSALMDDLLKLSRISQHEIERRLIVPEPVIQSIVSRIKEQYPDWKGTIECMVHDQICADYKLFQVVLENGIANAVKFTSKTANPVINIDSYIESGSTVICFADNGVGFDMKHVDRLFNPFQRLHHQDDFPGRGIGLSIIRRIMDKHEGRTWIESVVGQGTKLFVAFENVCI